jgi:hypothetical protein
MGGFVSPDGQIAYSREELEKLCVCEYPLVTEDEIKDKNKADAVTKVLALLQTTWFMLQCAVRLSQRLAITELELATVAFSLLNAITYALWWDKPMDAQCPIRVRKQCAHRQEQGRNMANGEEAAGQTRSREVNEQIEAHPGDNEQLRHSPGMRHHHSWSNVWKAAVTTPGLILAPFNSMMGRGAGDTTFFTLGWKTNDPHEIVRYSGSVLIATIFGSIHCIGWSFHFPSHTEQLLWRISSIATTSIPAIGTCVSVVLAFVLIKCGAYRNDVANFFIVFPMILYVLGRIMLLILCVAALRSPSPSSLQTVQWINFLPHV